MPTLVPGKKEQGNGPQEQGVPKRNGREKNVPEDCDRDEKSIK